MKSVDVTLEGLACDLDEGLYWDWGPPWDKVWLLLRGIGVGMEEQIGERMVRFENLKKEDVKGRWV